MMLPGTLWLIGTVACFVAAGISVVPFVPLIGRAALSVVLLTGVLVAAAFGIVPDPRNTGVHVLGLIAVCVLTVVAGSAVTGTVLELAMPDDAEKGPHGGILVATADEPAPIRAGTEVLRGGTVIGYLERFAIVGAALVGHLEIVAAVIAIKGLGRFTELDTAAARERFIVGTLTSACWAGVGATAAMVLR
ncbi:hypothetical protein [Curtobacterium sp. ISL-83]|uniref:hypothetical protein n=1 Tax=Curtobacterium sp. ISL-83 TaxID=2819145 RepID=UPI001BE6888F|nr:hypothetical protein [Curtobacterium sp. ISL-83]MBT2501089.1 hypothetical protein [Curtobacterium sp. ISL-83]